MDCANISALVPRALIVEILNVTRELSGAFERQTVSLAVLTFTIFHVFFYSFFLTLIPTVPKFVLTSLRIMFYAAQTSLRKNIPLLTVLGDDFKKISLGFAKH